MDVLAREADGCLLVVDYKSDRLEESEQLEAAVERDYGLQRLIYALAALRDGAAAVEVVHWFLERPAEPVAARYPAADRLELEERLAARLARASSRGFAVSEHPHRGLCLTCPGRATLCSWDEQCDDARASRRRVRGRRLGAARGLAGRGPAAPQQRLFGPSALLRFGLRLRCPPTRARSEMPARGPVRSPAGRTAPRALT